MANHAGCIAAQPRVPYLTFGMSGCVSSGSALSEVLQCSTTTPSFVQVSCTTHLPGSGLHVPHHTPPRA